MVHDISDGGTVGSVGVVHVVHAGARGLGAEIAALRDRMGGETRTVPLNSATATAFPRIYALALGETQRPAGEVTTFSSTAAFVNSGARVGWCLECEVGR